MKVFKELKERVNQLFNKKETNVVSEKPGTSKFLELISEFETKIKEEFQFELLQVYYAPYSFGSGHVAYKIKGRIVQITYDGKDNALGERPIEVKYSKPHAKFPSDGWVETKIYTVDEFWDIGINDMLEKSNSRK